MNCRDFDRVWNQLLDARRREVDADARERSLREHAESCASCRVRHRQLETLRQALEVWSSRAETPPTPAPVLARRILEAADHAEPATTARRPRLRPRYAAYALASAAAVGLVVLGPKLRPELPRASGPAPAAAAASTPARAPTPVVGRSMTPRLLGVAVDDATAASWQLALLASEPAARLGREMIDASFQADAGPYESARFPTSSDLPSLDAGSLSPAFNQMSDILAAGVRPLSTSARQAFGFLRVPRAEKAERPIVRPTAKGA